MNRHATNLIFFIITVFIVSAFILLNHEFIKLVTGTEAFRIDHSETVIVTGSRLGGHRDFQAEYGGGEATDLTDELGGKIGDDNDDRPNDPVCGDGKCNFNAAVYGDKRENIDNCPQDCNICNNNGHCEKIFENHETCPNDCFDPNDNFCDKQKGESRANSPNDCGFCGNNVCETDEVPGQPYVCPQDCPSSKCGNDACEKGENNKDNPLYCPTDCNDLEKCGDGICEYNAIEKYFEVPFNCPADCKGCGDRVCDTNSIEPANCPWDCEPEVCGENGCEFRESSASCPQDCPRPFCGNGICESGEKGNCEADCPSSDPSINEKVPCGLTTDLETQYCDKGTCCDRGAGTVGRYNCFTKDVCDEVDGKIIR